MRSRARPLWSAALAAAALFSAMPALAEESEPRSRYAIEYFGTDDPSADLTLCVLLAYERCQHTLDAAIEYGGGLVYGEGLQDGGENDSLQLQLDGGYFYRVSRRPSVQLGPVVGFEAERFREIWRYRLLAAARARLWVGRWVTVEAALGLVGSFDERFHARGVGGLAELALTLHVHLGGYVQVEVIEGPDGVETRVTGGFRGSLTAWAVIFAGIAG